MYESSIDPTYSISNLVIDPSLLDNGMIASNANFESGHFEPESRVIVTNWDGFL